MTPLLPPWAIFQSNLKSKLAYSLSLEMSVALPTRVSAPSYTAQPSDIVVWL
jgi:hypothetical protein